MTLTGYVPSATPVHRFGAGPKLLALMTLAVVLFAVPTFPVAGAAFAGVLLVGLGLARLPLSLLARQARAIVAWLVLLVVVHTLITDFYTGGLTAVRLLTLVLAAGVVTATTRVSELVDVVERLCGPLRWVGMRPARIGLLVAMTLRFIPLLAERSDRIREAQAARGGSARGLRGLVTTVVPLLVQVLHLVHRFSEALDARGADDAPPPRRRGRAPVGR